MLEGIVPIVFTPFDENGDIDAHGLRRILRFELDGGVHGIGINGFASEAYKLTESERLKNIEITFDEVAGQVPLIIGIAAGSTEAAIRQAQEYAAFQPAALMVLPPATMDNGVQALVDHYVALGHASDVPIIAQQAPHIPQYRHCALSADARPKSPIARLMSNTSRSRDLARRQRCKNWRPSCQPITRCSAAAVVSRC